MWCRVKGGGWRDDCGLIYPLVFLLVFLLALGSAAALMRGTLEFHLSERSSLINTAFQEAEAGLDLGLTQLRQDVNWAGQAYTPLGRGGYDVTVTSVGATLRRLTIAGYAPSNVPSALGYQRRDLEAVVSVQSSLFDYALFSATTVTLNSNALVDSYNSTVGSYGGSNVTLDGDVGSNAIGAGTITLRSNATLKGDTVVGPHGDVNADIVLDHNATMTGTRGTLINAKSLPPGTFSGSGGPTLTLNSHSQQTLPGGTYNYTAVTLNSNSVLTFTGDTTVYIDETLSLNSNSQLLTSCSGCMLTIYVRGPSDPQAGPAMQLDSNTVLSAGKPDRLQVMVTGIGATAAAVQMNSNSRLIGTLNAPLSPLTVNSNAELYGAAIAQSIQLNSNARIHYDTSLKAPGGSNTTVTLVSWRDL